MPSREEIRKTIEGLEQRGRGKRYPAELRKEIESYSATRREQGASLKQIAEELAISWRTLERWRRERRPSNKFRQVEVVAA